MLSILIVLLAVAFFTLLDRKLLALTAGRLGVNKVALRGIVQPLLDAIKLLSKRPLSPTKRITFLFFIGPLFLFLVVLGF
ncbi:MAG: hypothetical protein GY740_01650 [Gammaproteobacteria bacterium]|nr:hypothetical protein [Gammaproteobacteria bacterium]